MGNTKNIAFWIILFLLMVALFNVTVPIAKFEIPPENCCELPLTVLLFKVSVP